MPQSGGTRSGDSHDRSGTERAKAKLKGMPEFPPNALPMPAPMVWLSKGTREMK